MTGGREITIRGVTYPSINAAARIFGVSQRAIRHAIDRGTLDRVGIRRRGTATIMPDLPQHISAWLKAETPKGASVTEIIRAIITDAYHEAIECNS